MEFRRSAWRWVFVSWLALVGGVVMLGSAMPEIVVENEGKAKRLTLLPQAEVINAPAAQPLSISRAAENGFTPQARLGFTAGDQWEPAIAADRFGHVYVLYPQYGGVPGCSACASPTMILLTSGDHGASWSSPRVMYPAGSASGQWDAQILVEPTDGRTVYAAWLQNNKSDVVVAKSTDLGATWSVVTANATNASTDKPILVARGQDVYVAYNHAQTVWVSASHDGGATFGSFKVNSNGKLGWSLAGGGTVTPNGNVFFAWAGYKQNGGAKGPVNLYVSKSVNGGQTWSTQLLDVSGAPPDCSAYSCGWAFLGAQATMTSDASGNLYALWNANATDQAPNRIFFAKSADGGNSWSTKADVSTAPQGSDHAFPAIVATGNADVRIGWMDTRAGTLWNTYYRRSTNGGASWSAETDISTYVAGYSYIYPTGFGFPFGDYFEMDLDEQAKTHVVWGEGLNYDTPGSIWYSQGQ
jgi:hypothetical protein